MPDITKAFPRTKRDDVNDRHCYNPEPGDYWHEMFAPRCVVLAVAAGVVIYCETTRATDDTHWTWNLGHRTAKSKADFAKMLRYDSMDATIYNCEPRAHLWAAEHAENSDACA